MRMTGQGDLLCLDYRRRIRWTWHLCWGRRDDRNKMSKSINEGHTMSFRVVWRYGI